MSNCVHSLKWHKEWCCNGKTDCNNNNNQLDVLMMMMALMKKMLCTVEPFGKMCEFRSWYSFICISIHTAEYSLYRMQNAECRNHEIVINSFLLTYTRIGSARQIHYILWQSFKVFAFRGRAVLFGSLLNPCLASSFYSTAST